MKTLKTLKDLVIEKKCRKGPSAGATAGGAYWEALTVITRRCGGDGFGQSAPDITWRLFLRHLRDGTVQATLRHYRWHQNGEYSGGGSSYYGVDAVLGCTTAEEVLVLLHGVVGGEHECVLTDDDKVTEALVAFGLPRAAPAPDEE